MTSEEKRKAMQEFCLESRCPSCPVVVVRGLCEEYDWANNAPEDLWANAPEDLIEKAYLLAFGKIKEDKRMNITADDIRKAALELIGEMAQGEYECIGADGLSAKVTIVYIVGAKDLAEKMIEMIEEDEAE